MGKYLEIKAGKKAFQLLSEKGLSAESIQVMASAAGGPKWIILYALDQYLSGEFFSEQDLTFIGGSIGAWRSSCYLQNDPGTALERLQEAYLNQRYNIQETLPSQVSNTCRKIVQSTLGKDGAEAIINHPTRKLGIITSGTPRRFDFDQQWRIKWAFAKVAFRNLLNRASLNRYFYRHVFVNGLLPHFDDVLNTKQSMINKSNIEEAMLASGSIPMVMPPVIIDKEEHYDGGIVDYHIDLPFKLAPEKVVLVPHFFPFVKPGWFDKYHNFRMSRFHENSVLIYPTEHFISKMPDKKLTDISDFYTYQNDQNLRIKKWYQAADLGKHLVDDFVRWNNHTTLMSELKMWE